MVVVLRAVTGPVQGRRSRRVTEPRDGIGGGCVSGDERQGLGCLFRRI